MAKSSDYELQTELQRTWRVPGLPRTSKRSCAARGWIPGGQLCIWLFKPLFAANHRWAVAAGEEPEAGAATSEGGQQG
jgi:hypothetical protein